jgi:RNA polymerase primary sigma factor
VKPSRVARSRESKESLDEVYREESRSHFLDHEDVTLEEYVAEERSFEETGASVSEDQFSADDTLAVYLQQMGAVPLLSREEELELAQRLDRLRSRYRHAALWNWSVLARVVETFERIRAGQLSLDRSVDVVPSLGLDSGRIRARLPRHLAALRRLVDEAAAGFLRVLAARAPATRKRLRRQQWRQLRRAVTLTEELSPRTELLDHWTETLAQQTAQISDLVRQAGREHHGRALKRGDYT